MVMATFTQCLDEKIPQTLIYVKNILRRAEVCILQSFFKATWRQDIYKKRSKVTHVHAPCAMHFPMKKVPFENAKKQKERLCLSFLIEASTRSA